MALKFTNQKLHGKDFSNQDLVGADFRGCTLCSCKFVNCDLSYTNFEDANCWGADFTEAKLYRTNFRNAILAKSIMKPRDVFGCCFTLTCDTVEDMEINSKFWYAWLMLALLMKAPDQEAANRLISVIGADRYTRYMQVFKDREV